MNGIWSRIENTLKMNKSMIKMDGVCSWWYIGVGMLGCMDDWRLYD